MRRALAVPAILAALALTAAGCGSDDGGSASAETFDGISVVVGSKNFTEQYVLSEILLQGLAARGADVTDLTDTGDTPTTRAALLDGEIDAYWEYNSTGWVEHLGKGVPDDDGEALTDAVAEADSSTNGIEWLGRSTFNDTYGFVVTDDIAEETAPTQFS
ncbi:MAG: glycine/betaine ABC transporter substrate-binding protein, partial [Actinomycetia bacterium]|nr:glycine/betaine ABC transporter substrate-binding protein [Actinomycetes bacterium]